MPHQYTTEERIAAFWSKVNKNGSIPAHRPELGACWEWTANSDRLGYGKFKVNGYYRLAHRVAWMIIRGEIPDGLCVLHKCDNPPCCNPNHLFLGTQLDNARDKIAKGRSNAPKGEQTAAHKLTEYDVRLIRWAYAAGGLTHRDLSKHFGVSAITIYNVLAKRRWKHIK